MIQLLLTSPAGYAQRLQHAFAELTDGTIFRPLSMPMIQTDIYTDSPDFLQFIHSLDTFAYLAFSSRKAIESFAMYVKEHRVQLPVTLQYCAIGKDNELLRESLQVHPAFVSQEASPMGIVRTLQTIEGTCGQRIAVLAPQVIGMEEPNIVPDFLAGLQQIGMQPVRVTAYRTSAASVEILQTVRSKILQHEVHAVIFTSGTEINVFLRTLPNDSTLADYLQHTDIICYGPYTAQYAQKLGVKVDYVSTAFSSFQDFVQKIQDFYRLKE